MAKEDMTSDNVTRRPNEPSEVVTYWLNEISAARKRESDYRKEGQRVLDIYEGKKTETTPFNILYSNTETMLPALYSSTPRPVVQRRFKDDDPIGKAAATASQRILEFLLDTNIEGYETFDEGMKTATLDGLLPGRGVTSVKYSVEEGEMYDEEGDDENVEPTPYKKSELVCIDTRSWNRVFFGYARKWSKVPWVAYEEHIDREEANRLFGEEVADRIVYTTSEETDNNEDRTNTDADDRNTGERKTALVYQIWDREGGRKVRYVSAQYADGFLAVKDDPLQLTGFFNCPRPLQFLDKSNDLLPVAPYCLYENQAKELNRLTVRINHIVEALKARGVYDAELGEDIGNLMEAKDNALVPADKSSSLAAEKGLQNAIWFMPLDVLVAVLEKLYIAREQCKRVIYEVTGISDIIRGNTAASETATAQKIKSEWGTLRLKPKQGEVQRYARDLLRMMLEVAATKFSEETWAKMTGLPFVTTTQRQQLESVMQAVQMQGQQMSAVGQQPSPQQVQQLQQLQAEMAKPVWGKVLELLRDDMQRAYRVDIETNSTVLPEAVEDQKNIAEVMTALGQFLNGVTPLVVSGALPFQAAQSMMLAIVRRFRFGTEIEDYVKQMQAPKPPDDGKAGKEQAMQQQMAQKEAQAMQQKIQDAAKISQLETALKAADEEKNLLARKAELDMRELKISVAEDQLKMNEERSLEKIQTKDTIATIKGSAEQRVKQNSEQSSQKLKQITDKASGPVIQALQTIESTQHLGEMQTQLLAAISGQSVQNQQMMAEVVKAVTAPRRNKAIRGKDGKIVETVSEVVA